MQTRILVAITKARDVNGFEEAVDDVLFNYDKIRYYYYPSYKVRHLLRNFFLDHEEYTHLAILPDDLIVNSKAVNYLVNDIANYNYNYNYSIVAGCCNVDLLDNSNKINVSMSLVQPKLNCGIHHYNFLDKSEYITMLAEFEQPMQVGYVGDAFPIISRQTVKKLSFDNDAKYNNVRKEKGCCEDVVMSLELAQLGIPLYADLRACMVHLKYSDEQSKDNLLIGKKKEKIKFISA